MHRRRGRKGQRGWGAEVCQALEESGFILRAVDNIGRGFKQGESTRQRPVNTWGAPSVGAPGGASAA